MRRHMVSYTVSDKPSRMNADKNRNAVSKTASVYILYCGGP